MEKWIVKGCPVTVADEMHSRLLTFEISTGHGSQPASVLIDCGSTTNFISSRYVHKNHIPTEDAPRAQVVKLADSSVQFTCKIVPSFHVF